MNTAEAAKGRWEQIFSALDLPPLTGGKHWQGECPLCKGKGKFRFTNRYDQGDWICVCGSGDGFDLIMQRDRLTYAEAAKKVDELIGHKSDLKPMPPTLAQTESERFKRLQQLGGSPVELYLQLRGIEVLPQRAVRFSPSEYYDEAAKHPAMVAIAADDRGRPVYRHCTYLDGSDKIGAEVQRKLFTLTEYQGSCAVRLFQVTEEMGIAEGIETALSAAQIYKTPTWSTLNACLMERFKAPEGVKHLTIYADNDSHGRGLGAAFTCAWKNLLANNEVERVTVVWPVTVNDFNDMLLSDGRSVLTKELTR